MIAREYYEGCFLCNYQSSLLAQGAELTMPPVLSSGLKMYRKRAGLTQAQLAREARVSQQLITKIERGEVRETRKIYAIAKALGITAEVLLGLEHQVAEPKLSYHNVLLTRSAALLAAEWDKLDVPDRIEIEQLIHQKVAKTVRSKRSKAIPNNDKRD